MNDDRTPQDRARRDALHEFPEEYDRLLPWPSAGGGESYLRTDREQAGSFLSELADGLEASQIETARETLAQARSFVDSAHPAREAELASLVSRLVVSLSETIRVADSRGRRLERPGVSE